MRSRVRLRTGLLGVATTALVLASAGAAQAQLVVNDLDHGQTPTTLAQSLAGGGVTVSNVTYTGANRAAGHRSRAEPGTSASAHGRRPCQRQRPDRRTTDPACQKVGVEGPEQLQRGPWERTPTRTSFAHQRATPVPRRPL